jgi:hypothetical protein
MNSYTDYNSKLKSSIDKYNAYMLHWKLNRPSICLLKSDFNYIRFTHSKNKKNDTKTKNVCRAKKNNGMVCPSPVKKNFEYCHRHYTIFIGNHK